MIALITTNFTQYDIGLALIALTAGILAGFGIGMQCHFDIADKDDTELLDVLEQDGVDLDVFEGRETSSRGWRCYHPDKYAEYKHISFPTARDAIRDYVEKNTGPDHGDQE